MNFCQELLIFTGLRRKNDNPDVYGGLDGLIISSIPASFGSLLLFFRLQLMHDVTTFSQSVLPPRDRGMTWSRFNSLVLNFFPQ